MTTLLRGRKQGLGQTKSGHNFIWSVKDTKVSDRVAVLELFVSQCPF